MSERFAGYPMQITYRFEGLSLFEGSKAAGFAVTFPTLTLGRLQDARVGSAQVDQLNTQIRDRLKRSGLMPVRAASLCAVALKDGTAVPRVFFTGGSFGASISPNPESLLHLEHGDFERIGPEVEFTPHNTDSAKDAMALVLMVITWAEWANPLLLDLELGARR